MPHIVARLIGILLLGLTLPRASAAEYTLMPNPQTVHVGYFSAALKPVLTINSGDTVTIESVAGLDPAIIDASGVVPPSAVPEYVRAIGRDVTDRGPGPHILTGPIFINGAMPGDVLELRIQQIDLAIDYGNNVQRPYTGALPDEFPGFFQRIIPIDRQAKTATLAPGVVVQVNRPFFGVMGVAPLPAMGRISSMPPGVHTGNLDNKDLIAGTSLYLPVYAEGALFSVGDAHAAQGQGEVDLSAIETGLRGKFQFIVRKEPASSVGRERALLLRFRRRAPSVFDVHLVPQLCQSKPRSAVDHRHPRWLHRGCHPKGVARPLKAPRP